MLLESLPLSFCVKKKKAQCAGSISCYLCNLYFYPEFKRSQIHHRQMKHKPISVPKINATRNKHNAARVLPSTHVPNKISIKQQSHPQIDHSYLSFSPNSSFCCDDNGESFFLDGPIRRGPRIKINTVSDTSKVKPQRHIHHSSIFIHLQVSLPHRQSSHRHFAVHHWLLSSWWYSCK